MKKITNLLMVMIFFAFSSTIFAQGVTTSSMNGQVLGADGNPLPGASVVVIHVPSGTKYGSATDFDGFYRISGMRPGGPYKVTISYVGFKNFVRNNMFLQLGQTTRVSTKLVEAANALKTVVINAQAGGVFNANKTGTETSINQRQIRILPAASRSIADFVRITPQAQIREGNDGFSISLGGQNNRYNAIYIDGAVSNDVFGLAGSGTNGGQTGVNPFSVDAIESFQVALSPFDVRLSGFTGGLISAITRSGTNNLEGSAYYFLRNQDLAGKTPTRNVRSGDTRKKLSNFTAKTYGFRLGGPIVKDKFFFFANYERQENEEPQPFNVSNYIGDTDAAGLANLRNFVKTTYNYDIGGFENNIRTLVSDKITTKFDYNLNDNQKFSLKYSYVRADNLEARNSNNFNIGFLNGSEKFLTTTNSTSFEWNGNFSNKFSNDLIIGYTRVRDDRDPLGDPFPTLQIRDGNGRINFGAEPFSTANLLNQDIFTFTDNFEIYAGRHTFTLGTHNEFSKVKNLFFAFNFGDYQYNSVNDFILNQNLDFYEHGYSLVGNGTVGDNSAGAASFNVAQIGFYAQDEYQATENFKVTVGIRFDTPIWDDGAANPDFNTRTVALLEAAGKDLQGARVGKGVANITHISPKVGFNWDVNGDSKTQIRGGFGIFTSRLPLVWPGGTYNNNGITGGFSTNFNFSNEIKFNPDVNNQPEHVTPGSGGVGGNVDLFARGFKLPQVFRVNLVVDQKLPWWGLIATVDGTYNDNISQIYYQNLNLKGPIGFLNGADSRAIYNRRDPIDRTYGRIILASNTTKGYSWNTTFTLRKPFKNGFGASVSYSYGDSYAIFDGTSSQNSSQWRNIETVNGKNSNLPVTRSDFSLGNRITAETSYEFKWNDNVKTTVSLFYEGSQAPPFSYIYNDRRDLLNDDSRDNALIFVPANQGQIKFKEGANGLTAQQQWDALNKFIEGNDYLRSRRGKYAERNGDRGPWSHIVDLKLLQDFTVKSGSKSHTLQASFDIFNLTNLLNKNWGNKTFVSRNVRLLKTESAGTNPVFSFDPNQIDRIKQLDDSGIQSSRWQMQIGLRYIFK